ncbi:MAG: hypothetical protein SV765_16355 [Pseudomonadota bacterium]|nr:hypothetical protein [Pseudomonadales bacterium]MDY6921772.1 hypothetical protein [Pseudomonadota bacterium]
MHSTEPSKPLDPHEKPKFMERRGLRERRRRQVPVAVERRRQDRRNAHRRLRPEIRSLLENSGTNNAATRPRGGLYIDEDV